MNLDDFCAKVEWEGDVDGALDYGLRAADLDATDSPLAQDLKDVWEALEASYKAYSRLRDEAQDFVDRILDGTEEE